VKWAPDSWVKVILILALTVSFLIITGAMGFRAVVSELQVTSDHIDDIFDQFIGLFGVVVGYVLGSKTPKE